MDTQVAVFNPRITNDLHEHTAEMREIVVYGI
jgi:hypothetical protein